MRKFFAWLGAAALVVFSFGTARAAGPTVLKPYIVLILDTSGSMEQATGSGPPSCTDSGGNLLADTKLNHAKCAIYNLANTYGDMILGLGRFRNNMSGTVSPPFPGGCCSGGPDGGGGGCPNGPVCTDGTNMFEMLNSVVDGKNASTAVWVDGTGNTCTAVGTDPEIWNADSNTPLEGVLRGSKCYWLGQDASTSSNTDSGGGNGTNNMAPTCVAAGTGVSVWPSGSPGFNPIVTDPLATQFLPSGCDPSPGCASNCCGTQCRPYIVILLTDGAETCGGTPANAAASLFATDVTTGAPATLKRYHVVTDPIGFGVAAGDAQIEGIAHSGGHPDLPGQNEGFYANDQASLELAFSQIIEGSVRAESCNNVDDDCDGTVDEDFPCSPTCTGPTCTPACQGCDNGKLGVCRGTGVNACTADGTGVSCNITMPGGTPQTTCPVGKTCNPAGDETCNDGLDNDCDGFVDEGCTVCNPIAEICDAKDNDCDGSVDESIPTKQCGAFPGAACSPNAGCCGTQACAATPGCVGNACYGACNNTWTPTGEVCNGIDDDCDGIVDEDLTKSCSNITGGGCASAPCPETNNPGDPMVYHCTGLKQACTGPADMTCPGGVACVPPIPENQCHPGTEQCTGGAFGACTNEVTPTAEICDGLDNDCDNIIDEDTGGGACNATCGVGTILCAGSPPSPACCQPGACGPGEHQCGTLYCSAVSVTNDYTCDGVDDDCDGKVDEDWACGDFHCLANNLLCTGLGDTTTCPNGTGGCVATPAQTCSCTAGNICNGVNKCITGAIMCQGTPIDPSSCCDCAGTPQNGQCSGGAQCAANCQCAYPCSGGEFPCPSGKKCDMSGGSPGLCVPDPCFGVSCTNDSMGNAQQCVDATGTGGCVATCGFFCSKPVGSPGTVQQCTGLGDTSCPNGGTCEAVTSCPQGLRCYGPTGQCDPDDCTAPFPDRQCSANQSCIVDPNTGVGTCVTNPCFDVTCPSGQYCEAGSCIGTCAGKNCPSGQRCRLGACEPDPCGHPCPSGKVCNDATGACIDDPCQFRNCPQGQWCNSNDGMCEPDPCVGTMCPADPPGQICKGGTCYNASDLDGDAGTGTHVTVGGGGCSTGDGSGAGLLLVLGVLLVRRRRAENEIESRRDRAERGFGGAK